MNWQLFGGTTCFDRFSMIQPSWCRSIDWSFNAFRVLLELKLRIRRSLSIFITDIESRADFNYVDGHSRSVTPSTFLWCTRTNKSRLNQWMKMNENDSYQVIYVKINCIIFYCTSIDSTSNVLSKVFWDKTDRSSSSTENCINAWN